MNWGSIPLADVPEPIPGKRSYCKDPGWILMGLRDTSGRRGFWIRAIGDGHSPDAIEICWGREGGDESYTIPRGTPAFRMMDSMFVSARWFDEDHSAYSEDALIAMLEAARERAHNAEEIANLLREAYNLLGEALDCESSRLADEWRGLGPRIQEWLEGK